MRFRQLDYDLFVRADQSSLPLSLGNSSLGRASGNVFFLGLLEVFASDHRLDRYERCPIVSHSFLSSTPPVRCSLLSLYQRDFTGNTDGEQGLRRFSPGRIASFELLSRLDRSRAGFAPRRGLP